MLKFVAGLLGTALLLNANVASAAKRSFQQTKGLNAFVGATGQLDSCRSWTLSSSLSESSIKTEPGAAEVSNRAILSFVVSNDCDGSSTSFDFDAPNIAKLTGNLTGASLDLNNVTVTTSSCAVVDNSFECTEGTAQLTASLKWSSNGSPVRFKQHVVNLAPDGVRSSFHIEGNSRDATTTGSVSVSGQAYVLTSDNVHTSSLTSDARMFVVLNRK